MTPDRMEIARRLVACKGWVWLPGMLAASKHDDEQDAPGWRIAHIYGHSGLALAARINHLGEDDACDIGLWECVPDLDDDLTRLGVLAVVRRAWDDERIDLVWGSGEWSCWRSYKTQVGDMNEYIGNGPTEDSALLAALEAAPK